MYEFRKIQEQVIYGTVKEASNDDTARKIVFGEEGVALSEDNPTWVKNTMQRLEDHFDADSLTRIRMNCQCGYGMDEKLSFIKGLLDERLIYNF